MVKWRSCVQSSDFVTPWIAAHQAFLSFTVSQSLRKLMSIESVMPSSHLILSHPLLLPSIFPSIRVFSNVWSLRIKWPKYWSFSFSISPSIEYSEPAGPSQGRAAAVGRERVFPARSAWLRSSLLWLEGHMPNEILNPLQSLLHVSLNPL